MSGDNTQFAVDSGPTIAVLGCGRWGTHIVRDLVQLGCQVIAVDVVDSARQLALSQGAVAAHAALTELGGVTGAVEGVVVAGPTRLHAQLAAAALDLGVPVFVEKPMTDDVSSARELAALGAGRLFVMHKWHYHPGIEALAQLAQSGALGAIHGVTSSRVGEALVSDTDMLWLLAPHEITIGATVLGGYPVDVEAVAENVGGGLAGIDVTCHWHDGRWHRWTISTRPGAVSRRVAVDGSRAQAVLPSPYADHVELRSVETAACDEPRQVAVEQDPPLLRELRIFRDHVRGGPPPPTTAADGFEVVRIITEIRKSADLC